MAEENQNPQLTHEQLVKLTSDIADLLRPMFGGYDVTFTLVASNEVGWALATRGDTAKAAISLKVAAENSLTEVAWAFSPTIAKA